MSVVIRTNNRQSIEGQGLRRIGIAGISLGAMALIMCELPVILALIGLGSLSARAMAFSPPTIVELIGTAFAVMGGALLIALALHRIWTKRRSSQS